VAVVDRERAGLSNGAKISGIGVLMVVLRSIK
jgi:hypothetical protein